MPDLTGKLKQRLALIELELTDDKVDLLNRYLNLLDKWNKAFNLTAVRSIDEMLDRHIIDSLSIAQHIEGENWIDVGTGPGLPGIPLAIIFPNQNISLLDSNGKKTRFLLQAKQELGLDNIEVFNDRAENHKPEKPYDAVLSRAFADLKLMIDCTQHFCAADGKYYAMKGLYPDSELQEISKPYKVLSINWPGSQADRHLIIISSS